MTLPEELDHLVFAVPDLAAGVDDVAARVGVRPSPGGPHPGLGRRNFLLSLADASYLEIIGPDPEQGPPPRPRPFGIDDLERGSLVTWAVHVDDIERRVAAARKASSTRRKARISSGRRPRMPRLRVAAESTGDVMVKS